MTWSDVDSFVKVLMGLLWKATSYILLPLTLTLWMVKDFLQGALLLLLEPIGDALDAVVLNLDINAINVNLALVNSCFPIPEFLGMVGALLGLWLAVQTVKWVLKFIPTMG